MRILFSKQILNNLNEIYPQKKKKILLSIDRSGEKNTVHTLCFRFKEVPLFVKNQGDSDVCS